MFDEKVSGFFTLMDVVVADACKLFTLLDADSSGSMDANEFVDECLRMQGAAKSLGSREEPRDVYRHVQMMASGIQPNVLFVMMHAVGNPHVFIGLDDFNGYFYVRLCWTSFGLPANIVEKVAREA